MGLKFEKDNSTSTPKLCLHNKFPSNKREPLGMVTPPLPSFASIPFKWEEAPGKPRTTAGKSSAPPKSKTVRCLVPPPRLTNISTSKVTNMPSPTTVLDQPFTIGRSFSSSGGTSFWSPDGKERSSLSSSCRSRVSGVEGNMDFSSVVERSEDKVKGSTRRRIRRRSNSFLIVSSTSTSKVLSSIYESFKQAVPWKRMPAKQTRMTTS